MNLIRQHAPNCHSRIKLKKIKQLLLEKRKVRSEKSRKNTKIVWKKNSVYINMKLRNLNLQEN